MEQKSSIGLSIFRVVIKIGVFGLIGTISYAMYKDFVLAQAGTIKQSKKKYGNKYNLSSKNEKLCEEADQYLANHAGSKMNILRNNDFFKIRLLTLLKEKEQKLEDEQLPENAREKVKDQIKQIQETYAMINKEEVSFDELKVSYIDKYDVIPLPNA